MLTPTDGVDDDGDGVVLGKMPADPSGDAVPIPAPSQSIVPEPLKRKKRETQSWVVEKTWTSADYTEDSKKAKLQSLQKDEFG